MINSCPCGSSVTYQSCCQPLHLGTQLASSARQLMMSRYAAFVTQNIEYLICTHSPQTRATIDSNDVEQWAKACQWLALEVLETKTNSEMAEVEFIAWHKINNKLQYHHELSLFSAENIDDELKHFCTNQASSATAWYYHSAASPKHSVKLPKRNDLCICNSGKKFKKCCEN